MPVQIPLLAVDGGGTKCLAMVVDEKGNILGTGRSGSCNYQGVGRAAVKQELILAIREALNGFEVIQDSLDQSIEVECAVFALAGLDTNYDREIIYSLVDEALDELNMKVDNLIIENDGFAALIGATGGKAGVLVIAGTGSIVFGINEQGESARAGGWGHVVGDEGSGYWIGKRAITAILCAEDGRGKPTRLGEWILPHLGVKDSEDLYNWTYSDEATIEKIAGLQAMVRTAYIAGDEVSKELLEAAVHELFSGVRIVIEKLGLIQTPITIILQGGVLENGDFMRQLLMEKLQKLAPLSKLYTVSNEPIEGIIAMGLSKLKG
ncbi:N-acetylglucosamine kinase [Paenibacillus sp. KN14-4R]|uniref:N-acetylglucosamine kinase n=1 Tax=Paenibacillus sp. KN14-4R TaxID=3445773 RepID=UPI003F9F038B